KITCSRSSPAPSATSSSICSHASSRPTEFLPGRAPAAASVARPSRHPPRPEEFVMSQMRHRLYVALGVAVASLWTAPCVAQSWPERTVRVIVPNPAGVAMDVVARLFAERLGARWGQPVIVENLPGADGNIAVRDFAGRRDRHSLLYSFAGPITINPL